MIMLIYFCFNLIKKRSFYICISSISFSSSFPLPQCNVTVLFLIFVLFFSFSFTLFHLLHQASRCSAGKQQRPFFPLSHRHANGEVIQPMFVVLKKHFMSLSNVCVCVYLCKLLNLERHDCNLTNINICS